jgi:hydrogenase maturation protease
MHNYNKPTGSWGAGGKKAVKILCRERRLRQSGSTREEVSMAVLVLGLGNPLMSDDGFAVRVLEALASRYRFDGTVSLVEGGTLGIDLLRHLAGVERLLIVDALAMQAAPGTVCRLEGDMIPRARHDRVSVHQLGVQDLLALAEVVGRLPRDVVVWGVQPESLEMGAELTAPVAAAIEAVVIGMVGDLQSWGIACQRRDAASAIPAGCAGV